MMKEHYFFRDWKRLERGGVICIREESLIEQKKALKRIFSMIGSSILKGKSIMNLSLPVQIFKPEYILINIDPI